jgi:hypothetical protein
LVFEPTLEPLVRAPGVLPQRRVTAEELVSLMQDPFKLIGKQFVLDSNGDDDMEHDGLLYEVVGFGASKAKGKSFQVQYEDCVGSIEVDEQELVKMMKDSFLFA